MNAYEINSNRHILEKLIDRALIDTMAWVSGRCDPQEPDYIAGLSSRFLEHFFHILEAVFPSYDFSVSGVYCHQKPIVDAGLGKMPELGDILFVYAEHPRGGPPVLNSLLLQAKVSREPVLRIHAAEAHQLELYKKWPAFTYRRAGPLNGVTRDVLPKAVHDGAQYLLINNDPFTNGMYPWDRTFPMGCAVPNDVLHLNGSLSGELIDLLKFKSGRTVDSSPHTTKDEWSKVIWDILRIAAGKMARRKYLTSQKVPRRTEYLHFCADGMAGGTLLETLLSNERSAERIDDETPGVSVFLIESQANAEREG